VVFLSWWLRIEPFPQACSDLRERVMRRVMASAGGAPARRRATSAAMGSSTPASRARSRAAWGGEDPLDHLPTQGLLGGFEVHALSPPARRRCGSGSGARGGEQEVSHARQAHDRGALPPQGGHQPGHLRQAPGDEGGPGVVARAQAVREARGDGQHVLQGAAELHADHVPAQVDSEAVGGQADPGAPWPGSRPPRAEGPGPPPRAGCGRPRRQRRGPK